ncbi:MAG TPA: DNA polymerase subunit beta [Bacteroidales bacterium]|nr:DNA polymerase subunit beta [Bacteroidales bacterium]
MNYANPILQTIRNLKPELKAKYFVSSIGLFGSVVRDDFSPASSDVDIIVDFSQPVGIEFIDLADFLESQLKRKVDLISVKGIKQKYFEQIKQEIIYA